MVSANGTRDSGGLREQRRAAGLSQQRLAELAGCSVSAVRLFERGYQPSPSAVLTRVEAVLNNDQRPAMEPGAGTTSTSASQGRRDSDSD